MMSKEEFVKAMMRQEEWKRNEKKRQQRREMRQKHYEARSYQYDGASREIRKNKSNRYK